MRPAVSDQQEPWSYLALFLRYRTWLEGWKLIIPAYPQFHLTPSFGVTSFENRQTNRRTDIIIIIIIMTRSDQSKPPAVAIVRQNGLSSASNRASVAVTPASRQIWWIHVVDGWPQVRLYSGEGRSPSLAFLEIQRIWLAGTSHHRWRDSLVVSVFNQRPRCCGFESRWLRAVA